MDGRKGDSMEIMRQKDIQLPEMTKTGKRRLVLLVDATNRCQLACRYCYFGTKRKQDMDPAVSLAAVLRLHQAMSDHTDLSGLHVHFMGGEPLLAAPAMLDLASVLGHRFTSDYFSWGMTSNLIGLTADLARQIKTAGGTIRSSFDGPPDIQDRNRPFCRGSRPSSAAVEAHMAFARDVSPREIARMTVMPDDSGRLEDLAEYAFMRGFQHVGLFPAFDQPWSDWHIKAWEEALAGTLEMAAARYPEGTVHTLANFRPRKRQSLRYFCGGGRNLFAIDVQGRLHACHHLSNQERGLDILDLAPDDLYQVLRSVCPVPEATALPTVCGDCLAADYCNGGGCWAENQRFTGDPAQPFPAMCRLRQASVRALERLTPAASRVVADYPANDGPEDDCNCNDGSQWCDNYCVAWH